VKSWFISDLHLKNVHERNGNILLRFLFYLNQKPKENRLFLLGDIFDVWVSDGKAFAEHYRLIIDEIARFKKSGGEVFYFEGNHDVHIDIFWTSKFDIPVIKNRQYFNLDGLTLCLEHGDLINPQDKAYLQYRNLIHQPWVESLAHRLPSKFWKWFAEKQSDKSRKKTARYATENSTEIKKLIHTYAEVTYKEKPFDLIVTGHMHIYDDYEFSQGEKKIRSINLGTWLEMPRVLKIEKKEIEIINLDHFDQL